MVKFGDTLEGCIYEPWRDQYIQYSRLKRIITRNRFILDSRKSKEAAVTEEKVSLLRSNSLIRCQANTSPYLEANEMSRRIEITTDREKSAAVSESTPILTGIKSEGMKRNDTFLSLVDSGLDIEMTRAKAEVTELEDFFEVITAELKKVNDFFSVKIGELKSRWEDIESKRNDIFRLHHTGGNILGDLKVIRDIYYDLSVLIQYTDFNLTGRCTFNVQLVDFKN